MQTEVKVDELEMKSGVNEANFIQYGYSLVGEALSVVPIAR